MKYWLGAAVVTAAALAGCGGTTSTNVNQNTGGSGTRIGGSIGGNAGTAGAGNTGGTTSTGTDTSTSTGTGTGTDTSTGTTTIGDGSGLPCDIVPILTTYCTSCHSNPPSQGVPMPLLSYADLAAPSKSDATKSFAALSVIRMKDTMSPMPPQPATKPTATELAAFEAWVTAGLPMGACGDADAGAPDPIFSAPPGCDSNKTWTPPPGLDGSSSMYPGYACIDCHKNPIPPYTDNGPNLLIGGTVFVSGHTTDACLPTPQQSTDLTQAKVVIVDAASVSHTLSVNSNGNFYRKTSSGTWPFPYTAKVTFQGLERVMTHSQTSGDCNTCHTTAGTNGAPGRIALP
jgi:hypothetical protein